MTGIFFLFKSVKKVRYGRVGQVVFKFLGHIKTSDMIVKLVT